MIIFDLDGTLSIVGDRRKFLQQDPKDWTSFFEACDQDMPNTHIRSLYYLLKGNADIKIVTGRPEFVRKKTQDWLWKHGIFIDDNDLHMRADGDIRSDVIVKPELVQSFIDEIDVIFEDRECVVQKWRELGLCCCQVADGKF